MTSPEVPRDVQEDPVVPTYQVLCLVALAVIVLVLLQRGFGSWSLFPPLVGALGLLLGWRLAPQLLLLALGGLFLVEGTLRHGVRLGLLSPVTRLTVADVVLCGAVLAYAVAQFRLQSLQLFIFPPDPRRREPAGPKAGGVLRPAAKVVQQRRSVQRASPWEVGWLLLALPLWTALAYAGSWSLLRAHWESFGLPRWVAQGLLLAWMVGLALFVSAGLLGYYSARRHRPREAKLFLQDTLWQETRREQRRVNRWMAWARLRAAREKETP